VCRHLAYLGPLRDLVALLLDPPHSLLRQSYAPADMRGGGTINADGFGAGWYPDGATTPIRYRRAVPIWTDSTFAALAREVRSGAMLAAVRSATVGMPVVETACAPFATGRWLFSHNGVVAGWPDSVTALASRLPLAVRVGEGGVLVCSEPTDQSSDWEPVPDCHLLTATPSTVDVVPIPATTAEEP
jgi:gamma-glutamyl hercynylcysteine S-oxide hydrolase